MIHEKDAHLKGVEGALPRPAKRKRVKKKVKSNLQKKKENPNSGYWKRKASKAWGTLIHLIGHCEKCGRDHGKLDAHHVITKGSNILLMHSIMNGILLCVMCHKWGKDFSAHGTPHLFKEWFKERFHEKWAWIEENRYKTGKTNYEQSYNELCEELKVRGYEGKI